jgi:hypothetical protein
MMPETQDWRIKAAIKSVTDQKTLIKTAHETLTARGAAATKRFGISKVIKRQRLAYAFKKQKIRKKMIKVQKVVPEKDLAFVEPDFRMIQLRINCALRN